jgi:3-phenylpropionate/trans-cinnamate dioxygenase ferredoxin reductase component
MKRIVVVGGSLAGLRAVEALRRSGYEGRLTMIGAEPWLPYDRPPLSKEMLSGEWERDKTVLRKTPYEELELELRLGVPAVALNLGDHTVMLAEGTCVPYDGLVIATGSTPRRLPNQPELDGVVLLRTIDDCADIRERLLQSPRVCVIGAGFIGAEVAASCRARRLDVTLLEALPAPMVRGLGERLGNLLGDLHRDQGVDLRCGVTVAGFEGAGRVERVRLDDGTAIDADLVVVGVGVIPATDWLEGSGLQIENGVVCDETLLAAPDVVAAGDVARWPNLMFDGDLMRLEHWTNAIEQGVAAAHRLLGGEGGAQPFAPVPFVWSDQYDVKIQTSGCFGADDQMEVVHGSLEERRFTAIFGRAGRLVGALAFSMPRQLMQYRRMVGERMTFEDALARARAAD